MCSSLNVLCRRYLILLCRRYLILLCHDSDSSRTIGGCLRITQGINNGIICRRYGHNRSILLWSNVNMSGILWKIKYKTSLKHDYARHLKRIYITEHLKKIYITEHFIHLNSISISIICIPNIKAGLRIKTDH